MAKIIMNVEGYGQHLNKYNVSYAASVHLPANYNIAEDFAHQLRQYLRSTYTDSLTIVDCEAVPLLEDLTLDTVNIHELNFLAMRLSEFDENQIAVYNGLLPLVINTEGINKVGALINLTYTVNDFAAMPGINNDFELGEMLIDGELVEGIENMSDQTVALLDRKVIGEIHRKTENGIYVNGCFVSRAGFELPNVYKGDLEDYHPETYLFKFKTFDRNGEGVRELRIPLSADDAKYVETMRSHSFFSDFESGLAPITKLFRDEGSVVSRIDIEKINELATYFKELDMMSQIYIKAGLAYEGLTSFDEMKRVKAVFNDAYDRMLFNENVYAEQFGKDYLARHLTEDFPKGMLDYVDTARFGSALMGRLNGRYTDYGLMIDKSMTQLLAYDNVKEYQAVRIAGKVALLSPDIVSRTDVPKGIFKYELRSGDEYEYATLEKHVAVDFSGTILSKEPIDFGDQDYIDLTKGNAFESLEGRLTMAEYMAEDPPTETVDESIEMGSVQS